MRRWEAPDASVDDNDVVVEDVEAESVAAAVSDKASSKCRCYRFRTIAGVADIVILLEPISSDQDELATTDDAATVVAPRRKPVMKRAKASDADDVKVVEGPRELVSKAAVVVKNLILNEEDKAKARMAKARKSKGELKVNGFVVVLFRLGADECFISPMPVGTGS